MKNSAARSWLKVIIIAALFILFFSVGPGRMFFLSVTNRNNFSLTFWDDIKVLVQTGGLLLLMTGFPVIAVIVILVISKAGDALSNALIPEEDEEEKDDDSNKAPPTKRKSYKTKRRKTNKSPEK